METKLSELQINGVTYVPVGTGSAKCGKRAVVVVDRGWIFAGDVERANGRLKLTRAVWVFRWEQIGFDGVLRDPESPKVTIKKLDHMVDLPAESELFCVPVGDDWGF